MYLKNQFCLPFGTVFICFLPFSIRCISVSIYPLHWEFSKGVASGIKRNEDGSIKVFPIQILFFPLSFPQFFSLFVQLLLFCKSPCFSFTPLCLNNLFWRGFLHKACVLCSLLSSEGKFLLRICREDPIGIEVFSLDLSVDRILFHFRPSLSVRSSEDVGKVKQNNFVNLRKSKTIFLFT